MFKNSATEFLMLAENTGLLEDLKTEMELRRNEERLDIIDQLAALPPIEKTNIPALNKAAVAAHRTLELAQEAYMQADRKYKESSMQVYGAQLQFDSARMTLQKRAQELAPDFIRLAHDDLTVLDGLVQAQFRYSVETAEGGWFGSRRTITTSNGEALQACRKTIADAQNRLMDMTLEATPFEESQAETAALVSSATAEAIALGVSPQEFNARHDPVDPVRKEEDRKHRNTNRRNSQISAITSLQA